MFADKIVSAVPADSDTLIFPPVGNVRAESVDASGYLMSWYSRILQTGPETFLDQDIAVTNAAGFNFHAHLAWAGLRDFAFDQFKISTGSTDLRCFHFRVHEFVILRNE